MKADLTVCVDCIVDNINVVVNAFIYGFYSAGDNNLTFEVVGVIFAYKPSELLYELSGFFLCDEL